MQFLPFSVLQAEISVPGYGHLCPAEQIVPGLWSLYQWERGEYTYSFESLGGTFILPPGPDFMLGLPVRERLKFNPLFRGRFVVR